MANTIGNIIRAMTSIRLDRVGGSLCFENHQYKRDEQHRLGTNLSAFSSFISSSAKIVLLNFLKINQSYHLNNSSAMSVMRKTAFLLMNFKLVLRVVSWRDLNNHHTKNKWSSWPRQQFIDESENKVIIGHPFLWLSTKNIDKRFSD